MNEIIQVIMPKVAILDAIKLNYIDRAEAKSVMKVTLEESDNIEDVAAVVLEGVVQAHLLSAAGQFKQHASDRKQVICSEELAPRAVIWRNQRVALVGQPLRTNEYPRTYNKHLWLEATTADAVPNPVWDDAHYEMAIYLERDAATFDFIPLRVQEKDGKRWIEISGDFDIDPDGVDAVVFKR